MKKYPLFLILATVVLLAGCSRSNTSEMKSADFSNVQTLSQTQTQVPGTDVQEEKNIEENVKTEDVSQQKISTPKPEIEKEIHIDWGKPQPFPVPDFLKSEDVEFEAECNNVGMVADGMFKNWPLVACNVPQDGGMGYTYLRTYRLLIDPNHPKASPVIMTQEMDKETLAPYVENHPTSTAPIADLEYPPTISLDTAKGKLLFDSPNILIDLSYYLTDENYGNLKPKKVLYHDKTWGDLYEDQSMTNQGGFLLKRKDGSYVAYSVNYDDYLGWKPKTEWDEKSRFSGTDDMIWDDGRSHETTYRMGYSFHCEAGLNIAYIPDSVFDFTQLKKVATTKKADPLYAFSNIENDFFKYISENYHPLADVSQLEKGDDALPTIQKAVTEDFSILFWKDPLGRWVEFRDIELSNC